MIRQRLPKAEIDDRSADLHYKVRGFTGSSVIREYAGGGAVRARNGFAECASITFRFPLMCKSALKAGRPRTLYRRSALLAMLALRQPGRVHHRQEKV
jgi:hypothetical protein